MKQLLLLALIFATHSSSAQSPAFYVVEFTGKPAGGYSLSSPQDFLSARAIERRAAQNIPVDSTDLPLYQPYLDSLASTGVDVWARSRWFNRVIVRTSDSTLIDLIEGYSFVKSTGRVKRKGAKAEDPVEPVLPLPKCKINAPLDYGVSFNQANMIGADYLHNLGYLGDSMVVAVIDAGFYKVDSLPAFDSLRTRNRILGTWDFVENHASVYEDHSHGMMVLSAMGGYLPGELIGTAPHASYWLLRSEDAATETISEEYFWVSAAEFADSAGADVINSSLGYTTFDDPQWDHSYADMNGNATVVTKGADMAASKGMLVVNSAGNSGASPWNFIGAPADADSVLSVGAVDPGSNYAAFSSNGPSADGRIKPDVAAQGQQTIVAGTGGGVFPGNGTSFSSPVLAGAVTCLWQASKTHGNMEVINAVIRSGHQYNTPDTLLGYGIPDMAFALFHLGVISIPPVPFDNAGLAFPNPFTTSLTVDLVVSEAQTVIITLSDMSGRTVVHETKEFAAAGTCRYKMEELHLLASGVYLLQVEMNGGRYVRRVIRQSP